MSLFLVRVVFLKNNYWTCLLEYSLTFHIQTPSQISWNVKHKVPWICVAKMVSDKDQKLHIPGCMYWLLTIKTAGIAQYIFQTYNICLLKVNASYKYLLWYQCWVICIFIYIVLFFFCIIYHGVHNIIKKQCWQSLPYMKISWLF